jgi:sugar phosphate isomerase/epimerase
MELEIFRTMWGVEQPRRDALERVAAEGYAGVEDGLPAPKERSAYAADLAAADLHYISILLLEGATPGEQLDSLKRQLEDVAELDPRFVVCHTGRDAWPIATAISFLAQVLEVERASGFQICHETHRERVLYTPWQTRELLQELPELKLCCDYSHWVVVAERLLDDQEETLKLCAERCLHLHARVGFEEGPQVPDPAAPEFATHLKTHQRWWDQIWRAQEARGMTATTLTPEYGPWPYLPSLPYTRAPLADLWSISRWQAGRERIRFESGSWSPGSVRD